MPTESLAETLYLQAFDLVREKNFADAKIVAEQALEAAVRLHGVVEGDVDHLTLRCRLALIKCGMPGLEVDKKIQNIRSSLMITTAE